MTYRPLLVAAALSSTALSAPPAAAQSTTTSAELDQMRAEIEALSAKVEALSAQLDAARGHQQPAPSASISGSVAGASASPPAAPAPGFAFKGAPEIQGERGWSFKPRGRLQVDAGTVSGPDGFDDNGTGFASEVRRAYLGVEGKMPGGFGYRAEVDVADSEVEVTDLYLTYSPSKVLTLMVGQSKPFWGLEEMTSDLFTSFTERAAFNSAFGFERRLGINAAYTRGSVLVQGGVFTDNIADLGNDENNAYSLDGRVVVMPELAGGQAHVGGSFHYRELNDSGSSVRYRARPFIHTTDLRFVDTTVRADSETGYGLEAAWIKGPLHIAGEGHWQRVGNPDGSDPTFFGGYAEAGLFLTRGDTRGYKNGALDRVSPKAPIGGGGIGAVQIVTRFDLLDLSDGGFTGGVQNIYGLGLVWTLAPYTRLMANYGHIVLDDAVIAEAGGDRDYSIDAFGMRAQIDF